MAAEGHPKDGLQELLDSRLRGEARARVEEHLASCAACRRELEALRLTKLAARRAFAAEPAPQALQQAVLQALDQEGDRELRLQTPKQWRIHLQRRRILTAGLAAFALVAAALYL